MFSGSLLCCYYRLAVLCFTRNLRVICKAKPQEPVNQSSVRPETRETCKPARVQDDVTNVWGLLICWNIIKHLSCYCLCCFPHRFVWKRRSQRRSHTCSGPLRLVSVDAGSSVVLWGWICGLVGRRVYGSAGRSEAACRFPLETPLSRNRPGQGANTQTSSHIFHSA